MKLRLAINCLACAILFGMWQDNVNAGQFMFCFMGFVLSCIDYAKDDSE